MAWQMATDMCVQFRRPGRECGPAYSLVHLVVPLDGGQHNACLEPDCLPAGACAMWQCTTDGTHVVHGGTEG